MAPAYDEDSPEWLALLKAIETRSVADRELLNQLASDQKEFREDWLVTQATQGEQFKGVIRDIKDIKESYKQLNYDLDKTISNHTQDRNNLRQELMDANMERHDCKAEIEQKIADMRVTISSIHPTWAEIKKIFIVAMFVMTATTGGMMWVINNMQTKNHDHSISMSNEQLLKAIQDHTKK